MPCLSRIPGRGNARGNVVVVGSDRSERLLEIVDQIVDVLDADRQTDRVDGHAGGFEFCR